MRAVCVISAAVMSLLATSAATADAAKLRGETGRGLRVRVTTDDTGAAKRIVFHWWVHRCSRGRYRFNDQTLFHPRGKPPTSIRGGNPYRVKYRGGFSARIVAHVTGHRLSIYGWRGWFSATATLKHRGRVVDRCHFKPQRWHATTPRVRLDFSGDDYIAHGESWSFATPSTPFYIEDGAPRSIVIEPRGDTDYTFTVGAPFGHRLRRGRYPHASSFPTRRRASIGLSGDGRACGSDELGEFTITRVKFDRQGLVLLAGSFIHRCRYESGEAHGTFSYHR